MENSSSTTRRKNYRRKQRVDENSTTTSESVTTTTTTTATTTITTEESANETIEDLLELQRLRRRAAGMNTHKLQAPLEKKKKNKDASKSTASQDTSAGADTEKKSTLAFTGQTNIVDVDKHMMAYIEKEMRKQKDDTAKDGQGHDGVEEGNNDDDDEEEEEEEEEGGKKAIKALDPFYALYMAAEKNKLDSLKEKEAEGNLTNSSAMLTKVQEVDLGMDARLRNIEKTEKAKRKLQEDALSATGSTSHIMDNVPSRRFYLPPQNPQSMLHPSQQMATDHAVAERFKKYQRRV